MSARKTLEKPRDPETLKADVVEKTTLAVLPEERSQEVTPSASLSAWPKVLIVIPSFNEEPRIARVLEPIRDRFPEFDLLVVDDGSCDGTQHIARECGAEVITLPFNTGYGVALQTGFIYAVRKEYPVVVQLDADGQHDPLHIKDLLEALRDEDVDVVVGSRFMGPGKYRTSLGKKMGMMVFGKMASLFCGRKVSDPTSGFQAMKGRAIEFVASDAYPPDYPDADFLIMLNRCGFRVREIPVQMNPSPGNKSMHTGPRAIYYVFKMLLSIFVTLLRQKPKF